MASGALRRPHPEPNGAALYASGARPPFPDGGSRPAARPEGLVASVRRTATSPSPLRRACTPGGTVGHLVRRCRSVRQAPANERQPSGGYRRRRSRLASRRRRLGDVADVTGKQACCQGGLSPGARREALQCAPGPRLQRRRERLSHRRSRRLFSAVW